MNSLHVHLDLSPAEASPWRSEGSSGMQAPDRPVVRILEAEAGSRQALCRILGAAGHEVAEFGSVGEMLLKGIGTAPGCIVLGIQMPGPSGLDLQAMLAARPDALPMIFVTGRTTSQEVLRAMKQGAVDFFLEPLDERALLAAVAKAVADCNAQRQESRRLAELENRHDKLTTMERRVLDLLVTGALNKQIGAELGIAERTVKAHRAHVMQKMGAHSLADLVRAVCQSRQPGRAGVDSGATLSRLRSTGRSVP